MIDLKDLAFFTLTEGILDDIEDQMTTGDNTMNDMQLTDWSAAAKNTSKPYWRKTKKGYVIKGNFKINDIEDTYTGPLIKQVIGNITICNSELTSLEDIFTIDCVVSGTLTIEDNPNLTSLKGCPLEVGSLTIANNKSLKKIDLTPVVKNNAYISGNGKKFKKEDLEKTMQVFKHIFCSVDEPQDVDNTVMENTNIIMEAFKAPQLKLIVDAIKKASTDLKSEQPDIADIRSIKWDKIDASDITEYDTKDPEGIKVCRKCLSDAEFSGIIVLINKEGVVTTVITGKSGVINLVPNGWRKLDKYNIKSRYSHRTSDLIHQIATHSDTIMIIDLNEANEGWSSKPEGRYSTRSLKYNRQHSKEGAIAYQRQMEQEYTTAEMEKKGAARYYRDIVLENYKRYKRLIEEIKAKRALENSNKFASINDRIDKCYERYLKLVRKIAADAPKYKNVKYDFDRLTRMLTGASSSYASNNARGVMDLLKDYLKLLMDKEAFIGDNRSDFDKMYNNPKRWIEDLRKFEDLMDKKLIEIESILKTFENI